MTFQKQQTTLDQNSDTVSQFLASLLSKSSDSTVPNGGSAVDFAKLLSSPENISKLSRLIPTTCTGTGTATSTSSGGRGLDANDGLPGNGNGATSDQSTVGLPNMNNAMITTNRLPIQSVNNIGHSINNFIFGPSPSANTGFTIKNGNGNDGSTSLGTATAETVPISAVADASSALPSGLQTQLLSAMKGLQALPSQTDIEKELEKEQKRCNARRLISQQLDNLKQQIERQEEDDKLRLQALQFMKLMKTQMQNHPPPPQNQLPINVESVSSAQPIPLTISPVNNTNFAATTLRPHITTPSSSSNTFSSGPTAGHPPSAPILPLPKFLSIPPFEADALLQSTANQQSSAVKLQEHDAQQLNIRPVVEAHKYRPDPLQLASTQISQSVNGRNIRFRRKVQPQLVCSAKLSAEPASGSAVRPLPTMSNSKEWSAVSHADDFKQSLVGFKEDPGQRNYQGHGRVTIISATGKIQPRKDMDASQCALLCNLMVELCFTESLSVLAKNPRSLRVENHTRTSQCKLTAKAIQNGPKSERKPFKIDPEICLRLNLNTGTKLNGFSSMIHGHSGNGIRREQRSRSAINIVPPTFQQTSSPLQSVNIAPPSIPSISSFPMMSTMPNLENDAVVSSSSDTANSAAPTELEGSDSDKD